MRYAFLFLALALAACSQQPQSASNSAPASAAAPVEGNAPLSVTPISAAAPASAASMKSAVSTWKVDAAKSSISFTGKHTSLGNFTGTFKGWTAQISFDPADLAHAKVNVTIPTGGVKTGQTMIDEAYPDKEWFDVKAHPTATFAATSFKSLGANKYEATGTLTFKGKAYPQALPFTLTINGNTADANAAVTLDRTKLDIGMQSDANGDWVGKSVNVTIKVHATR